MQISKRLLILGSAIAGAAIALLAGTDSYAQERKFSFGYDQPNQLVTASLRTYSMPS